METRGCFLGTTYVQVEHVIGVTKRGKIQLDESYWTTNNYRSPYNSGLMSSIANPYSWNIPALDLTTRRCHITSQVDASTLPSDWKPYFVGVQLCRDILRHLLFRPIT